METYLRKISGWEDALISMYLSKRTLTRELEGQIRYEVEVFTTPAGAICEKEQIGPLALDIEHYERFINRVEKLLKWSPKHTTMARFIDLSFMTYGMHRGGQDDIDSHAKRFNNRIIRSSTRLADFGESEKSDFYKGKIMTTDEYLASQGTVLSHEVEVNGKTYVRSPNGYVLKEYAENKDVKRGLYMLSIPSDFVSKIDLTEFAHVYKERGAHGTANPEVKEWAESLTEQLSEWTLGMINRDYLMKVQN